MKRTLLIKIFLVLSLYSFSQYKMISLEEKRCCSDNFDLIYTNNKVNNILLQNYDVTFYKLDLHVERDTTAISGNVSITAKVLSSYLDTFCFELDSLMIVDSIKINNVLYLNYYRANDFVFVSGLSHINYNSLFTAEIFYHGTPVSSGFFSGLSSATSGSWGNKVTWTLSEPFNAKIWWPCKQDLKDKADSVYVFITTCNENKVGSNGILTAVVPQLNNKVRYEWKSRYPIDYYLISFSVSKYIDYSIYAKPTGSQDSILIQNYLYDNPVCFPYYKQLIDLTKDFLELFSDLFGPYPFKEEKYGHCMAPISGGMEHQTMTTLGYFSFRLVAHELAHQWFGNNVTCATWSDIWINEGFATYGEYLAKQYLFSQEKADTLLFNIHKAALDKPDGSVYIPPSDIYIPGRIFNGALSYYKGASIIHMIRFELQNDSLFFRTIKEFQQQYKDSVATGLDFKRVLELTSGKSFTDFFNQWYFGEGYPVYHILWGQHDDTLYLTSTQFTSCFTTPLFKMLMEYKVKYSGGDTIIKVFQETNVNNYKIPISHNILDIEVDPNNWVLNKVNSVIQSISTFESSILFAFGPNPCSDYLYIYLPSTNYYHQIEISDLSGRILFKEKSCKKSYKINTLNFSNGLYLLKISDKNGFSVKRFVKN